MKKSLILISIFLLLIGYLLWHHESRKNNPVNNTLQKEYHESDLKIKEENLEENEDEIFTENIEKTDIIDDSSNHYQSGID